MSAQPADAHPPRRVIRIAKTVSAIRAALPADRRAEFQVDLESTPIPQMTEVLEAWWRWAVVLSDPDAVAAIATSRAGTSRTYTIEEVFGAERWAAIQHLAA